VLKQPVRYPIVRKKLTIQTKKTGEKMNANNLCKVYSANSQLSAFAIQSALEMAGVPAIIACSHNGSYMDVLVPASFAFDASNLLNPERRSGELFWVASK
jgi:hypothetical protein